MAELTIQFKTQEEVLKVLGPRDQHLRAVREALGIKIIPRDRMIYLEGPDAQVAQAERIFNQLREMAGQGPVAPSDVQMVLDIVRKSGERSATDSVTTDISGRAVRPRTDGQGRYLKALRDNDIILCVGPAGTGKTYLAVAWAVNALRAGQIKRIVLCRPAVEAGERLGYLPGDLQEKVNPYLRPLLDAIEDIMPPEQVRRHLENDVIELSPLAYMRGRTLSHAAIILDEGQNTTITQMRMFLTRMGRGSKIIVTGDITQTDLPRRVKSGLADAAHRLRSIERIGIVHLSNADIVRHPMVQEIVNAYERD